MIAQITLKMMDYFQADVRRINHALKVFSIAKTIGVLEALTETEQMILEVSALLHDIGIKEAEHKYNTSSGKYQELEGPPVAKELLIDLPVEGSTLDRILYLIGHHHSYECIDHIDFQILVEADFLVNIYEDEMNEHQIKAICDKYIKTQTGIHMIASCYPS